jgi:hypothetical protein
MTITIALPGLLLALLAATGPIWNRIPFLSANATFIWLGRFFPWLRSAGFLYLAVLAGWISMRDAGIAGQSPSEWFIGGAVALLLGGAGGWLAKRYALEAGLSGWFQDELRWTLYRGAIWPLVIFLPVAVPLAFLVAFLEWRWEAFLRKEAKSWPSAIPWLARAVGSSTFFLVAHNLWLALAVYVLAYAIQNVNFKIPLRN